MYYTITNIMVLAPVAEPVDALDSKSSIARCRGSSPLWGTNKKNANSSWRELNRMSSFTFLAWPAMGQYFSPANNSPFF